MKTNDAAVVLQELIIRLQRKLGFFDDLQSSCCGVSFAQCHAMAEIDRSGSISLNELAERLGLDKSTMSRTVDNLVNNKMAIREPNPADRRCVTIQLTPKGMAAIREIETGLSRCFETLYDSIAVEKRPHVLNSLQVLLEALEKSECCK
jgi:DNA-binding MarR family transcriptional regulator